MQKDMGSFGGKHIDDNDSPGGTTSMITFGDIDEKAGEDPGRVEQDSARALIGQQSADRPMRASVCLGEPPGPSGNLCRVGAVGQSW